MLIKRAKCRFDARRMVESGSRILKGNGKRKKKQIRDEEMYALEEDASELKVRAQMDIKLSTKVT